MLFVILQKYRAKPTPEIVEGNGRLMADLKQKGLKVHGAYYTLGQYDAVLVVETPASMDVSVFVEKFIRHVDVVQTETMLAVPQGEVPLPPHPGSR